MKKNRIEIIDYVNSLKGYEGYVQFSNRPISKEKDIFLNQDIKIEDESGFIYEAHFCNEKESIQIKQLNDSWFVSTTDVSNIEKGDIQLYASEIEKFNYKVKMVQVWEEIEDALCENIKVKKLKKVVFAGFEKGDTK